VRSNPKLAVGKRTGKISTDKVKSALVAKNPLALNRKKTCNHNLKLKHLFYTFDIIVVSFLLKSLSIS